MCPQLRLWLFVLLCASVCVLSCDIEPIVCVCVCVIRRLYVVLYSIYVYVLGGEW